MTFRIASIAGARRAALPGPGLLLALLLALPAVPVPAQPVATVAQPQGEVPDPFYAHLLEEGILTYQRGATEEAAEDLRLAVFGLLDQPRHLVRGLAYLALAEASAAAAPSATAPSARDAEALRDTLSRLVVVEDRFQVLADADLPAATRAALDALLRAQLPEATLLAAPTFRDLGEEKLQARLQALRKKLGR